MTGMLGSTKVSTNRKISLVKEAAEKLGVEEGDYVIFYENENGKIVLEKG